MIVNQTLDQLRSEFERLERENTHLRHLITQIFNALPANRDWLDPSLEQIMKVVVVPALVIDNMRFHS